MDRVFTEAEFSNRVSNAQASLIKAGLTALIVTRRENIYYLTGFRGSHFAGPLSELHALVLPAKGRPRLMTRALEKRVAEQQWSENPSFYMDHESPYDVVKTIFFDDSIPAGRVGVEERHLSVHQLQQIKRALPQVQLVDATGLVEKLASKPSPAEAACLQKAASITNLGFEAGVRAVGDGVYPYEIVAAIHDAMYRAGQSDFDMSMVCVWAGEKGGRMHDTRATERIKAGDAVTIEIFGIDQQYKVGAQGTVFVNRQPSVDIQRSYALLVEMFKAGRSAVRPGASAGDIYDAANGPYRKVFGADYYRKVGGSMGLTIFNIPLVKGNKQELEPGTCLLLQVLVDDPALITCSSTILLTDRGFETLTKPLLDLQVV